VREGEKKKRVGRRERRPGERERKRKGKWACARRERVGPRGRGEKGQAGLLLDWLLFSFAFPFSISFPDFQTKIHLNSIKF
jgi:hypothetical protein